MFPMILLQAIERDKGKKGKKGKKSGKKKVFFSNYLYFRRYKKMLAKRVAKHLPKRR